MRLFFVILFHFIVSTRMLEKAQTKPQLPVTENRTDPIRLGHASLQSLLFFNRFVLLTPIRSTACAGGLTGSEDRLVVSPPKKKIFFYGKRFYLITYVILLISKTIQIIFMKICVSTWFILKKVFLCFFIIFFYICNLLCYYYTECHINIIKEIDYLTLKI